jgi:hypothetical protein
MPLERRLMMHVLESEKWKSCGVHFEEVEHGHDHKEIDEMKARILASG